MPLLILLVVVALIAVVFGPSWWVKRIMTRYSEPADRYPGTGGELARYLLDQLGLTDVGAEITEQGDHYDPDAKCVRLTPDKFNGRSLTAITVAAHEVGHALQDASGYAPLRLRTRLVIATRGIEKLGAGSMGQLGAVITDTCGDKLVREVMTHEVTTVPLGTPIKDACILMKDNRIHQLPVVSEDSYLEGIVSTFDLIGWFAEQ